MIITQKQGTLEYLTAEGITVPHCFTTKLGGVSTGVMAGLNIAYKEEETMENVEENLRILGRALSFDPKNLVLTRQNHSDVVRVVTKADHTSLCHRDYPWCDGLVTSDPGVALMIFTADCTPLLFHDPVTGAVGAAHAGWRGTASQIGARVVETMVRSYGCDPANIRAAIGPNVGYCHFETDADVPEAMLASYGEEVKAYIRTQGEKFYLDLKAINALSLRRAGVSHIEISQDCTMCCPDKYWSHRITGSQRGSQGAVIVCKEAAK